MNEKREQALAFFDFVKSLFNVQHCDLTLYNVDGKESAVLWIFTRDQNWESVREVMRALEIQLWNKDVNESFCWADAEKDGILVHVYSRELPPTCRKVTTMRRVPKTETRETGEFIEVPETKIVCGDEPQEEQKQ